MIDTGCLEFAHIAIHPADDLIVVIGIDLRIFHIPPGQLFGQDLIEYIVFIKGDGFMDAAFHIGSGRDGDTIPILGQYIHLVIPAQIKKLAFQIVIISKTIFATGRIENPVSDIYHIQKTAEFFCCQIDLHRVPPKSKHYAYYSKEISDFQMEINKYY